MKNWKILILFLMLWSLISCEHVEQKQMVYVPDNVLDYTANPVSATDRSSLAFSDQGAWFAYGFPTVAEHFGAFSGPFLMTQENGVWSSPGLAQLSIMEVKSNQVLDWSRFVSSQKSYASHLEQSFENENLIIEQKLFFSSAHTAMMHTRITNRSDRKFAFKVMFSGQSYLSSLHFSEEEEGINIQSDLSSAEGHILCWDQDISHTFITDSAYIISLQAQELRAGKSIDFTLSQSFIFPEYSWEQERNQVEQKAKRVEDVLEARIHEKQTQLQSIYVELDTNYQSESFKTLVAKTHLTLQNNWRTPAGALKHAGLFPSYHYQWFHGFWAWDSWKHAVALSRYDVALAKDQIRALYDYMDEEGFIADCIYRDTAIEKHNYRNTKAPLSAWAVWKVFEQDQDTSFLVEMYPQIKKQHAWWYKNRDHDQDGLCEYGSRDGTLVAAKWESGMDNAVRFDESQILQYSESAWSLNQESVDLNAYLYAEKGYLAQMAGHLNLTDESANYEKEAKTLKTQVKKQFFDTETGWFYDTSLDGKEFVKVMGCEGWIPLWARIADSLQAERVKENMMNEAFFNVYVPLQTLSASHAKFKPEGGYWRGPVWLDQSYFGVLALKNYGYHAEALQMTQKLMYNAKGVLSKGASIRENYQPITGKGLESESFSWSAAHYLLLLLDEKH